LLRRIVGVAFAIVFRAQQAIDIVKEVFIGDRLAGTGGDKMRKPFVDDGVAACVSGRADIRWRCLRETVVA